jgi:hypothetical protein
VFASETLRRRLRVCARGIGLGLFCGLAAVAALESRSLSAFAARVPSVVPPPPQIPKAPAAKPKPKVPARVSPVGYRKVVSGGVPMHVVQVDLSSPHVRLGVVTPRNGIGFREAWSPMVERARPAAAITGTYFCTSSGLPIGSIVVGGRLVCSGATGTAFTFSAGKGAKIISCLPRKHYSWKGHDTVLRAGPRLLTSGKRTLSPPHEGFRDPAVYAAKRRTALGVTKHGKLLLVAVNRPVRLRTLADAMTRLGAVDAMCLDGGGSTALYHRGKTWVKPDRPLTNLLVVYEDAARFEQVRTALNPVGAKVAVAPVGGGRG